jgi:hypothetical protein
MKREQILREIKKAVLRDKRMRRDPRYIKTITFLIGKGFLFTNHHMLKGTNLRLQIDDAIWAGRNLEPRILEVLPATVLRLGKHFDFDPIKHKELARTIEDIKNGKTTGHDFFGVPYEKLKVWANFKIKDGRVKTLQERRVTRTFRLKPRTFEKLQQFAKKARKNVTAVIEDMIQNL